MHPKEGMKELLTTLKQNGKNIYVLSNASIRLPECYKEFLPATDLYDGVLFSASVKYIKPQPKIYEIFFEKFNLKPETCFFVDDRKDNITGANHVVHFNLEWNPSLEDQSSARAYRRGQTKTVFIYRLYYVDTVEQIVNERIERKREIASTAVVGTDGVSDRTDILRALELAPDFSVKG